GSRHCWLVGHAPTARPNRARSAGRTRRVLVPGSFGFRLRLVRHRGYGLSWRNLRRLAPQSLVAPELEVTPPSISNHSRYDTVSYKLTCTPHCGIASARWRSVAP